ncbi:MAG: 6-phospho-3-hexuloisomerase [Sediminibacterium sp.]|nr:6-phospho-3-hexuloisomerase [Sediminibacterium sp.]
MKGKINQIINELTVVLGKIDETQVDLFIKEILGSNKIVVCGAGRVGMAIRGFGMRLGHLGFSAFTLGDSTVPSIAESDLLIVASGSGETQTIFDLVSIAKKNKARIAAVTGNPESRIGKLADAVVKLEAPSKTKQVDGFISIQPMTTLNEQCLGIFFDAVVLKIMDEMKETHDTMWARHSNLE